MTPFGELAGKRVLITGATGFIGSHLLAHLCELGASVHAVSREQQPDTRRAVRWYQSNIADLSYCDGSAESQ